jgi:hypothetical protein
MAATSCWILTAGSSGMFSNAVVGAAQEWRICNQGVAPPEMFSRRAEAQSKAAFSPDQRAGTPPPPSQLVNPTDEPPQQGKIGLGTLATFSPPYSCPSFS